MAASLGSCRVNAYTGGHACLSVMHKYIVCTVCIPWHKICGQKGEEIVQLNKIALQTGRNVAKRG